MTERMRIRDNKGVAGPVVDRGDDYISIEYETTEIITRKPWAFEPAPPALETPRMLVLSTAHITKNTVSNFEMQTDDVPTFYPKAYPDGERVGYLIPLVDGHPWSHMISADLVAIRILAEANDCTWIMLDRDAEVVDALPSYDW